jgi:hypothetical protein
MLLRMTGTRFIVTTAAIVSLVPGSLVSANPQSGRAVRATAPGQLRGQQSTSALADDTLIITLNPGANQDEVKQLLEEAHGTVIQTLHVDSDNYDILFVKPERGKFQDSIKTITKKKGKNVKAIDGNYRYKALAVGDYASPPNDPMYSYQWNLVDIGWTPAQAQLAHSQKHAAHITIIDTGCNVDPAGKEFTHVKQFNCTGDKVTEERPVDVDGHGTNCVSIAAATTDNASGLAGVASFSSVAPVYVTMLRITTPQQPEEAQGAAIVTALVWALNHPAERNGRGAISMSFGGSNPPLWSVSALQTLAQSYNNHGDHLFLAAGNDSSDQSAYPEGAATVVQATDSNDQLAFFSTTLSSPEAAPGVNIPAIWGAGLAPALVDGTSEATPMYAACAAMIQSCYPHVNAYQAAQVLLQTGKTTSQGKIIPQLNAALGALEPPPKPKRVVKKPPVKR